MKTLIASIVVCLSIIEFNIYSQNLNAGIYEDIKTTDMIEIDNLYFIVIGNNKDEVKIVDPINHIIPKTDTWSLYRNTDFDIPSNILVDGNLLPVTVIESGMFISPNIESIKLPTSIKIIEPHVCSSNSLRELAFSNGLEVIMNNCFNNLPELKSVEIPESLYAIADNCFNKTSITNVKFNEGLGIIGQNSFSDNIHIEELLLPGTLTKIGQNSFCGLESLKRIEVNSDINIGDNCFNNCPNIEEIVINSKYYPEWNILRCFKDVDRNKCRLIVPEGCAEMYRRIKGFMDFQIYENPHKSQPDSNTAVIEDNCIEKVIIDINGVNFSHSQSSSSSQRLQKNGCNNTQIIIR